MNTDLTKLQNGEFVILPTFQCNARCDHCLHTCSWERLEKMPLQLFRSCINQALNMGWTTICLSGGEPFLVQDHIRVAANICSERGVALVIQTNGFWGQNANKALKILQSMRGITQISYSVDKIHLKEIGLEPVLNAINATIKAGIKNISITISYQTNLEFQILKKQFTSCFKGIDVAGWPILPIGQARNHPELMKDYFTYTWDQLPHNCDAQMRLSPIIHPKGDIHTCYHVVMALEENDPLILGNLNNNTLAEILDNVNNKLSMFIVAYGGGNLGYLLYNSPYEGLMQKKYQSVCHFCFDVLSRPEVVAYLQELFNDEAFGSRIMDRLKLAYNGWKKDQSSACTRILICNGSSCRRNYQNYPIINYLINRIAETKKSHFTKVGLVNCLNSCGTGPNLYLEQQARLVKKVDIATIDRIVDEIQPS